MLSDHITTLAEVVITIKEVDITITSKEGDTPTKAGVDTKTMVKGKINRMGKTNNHKPQLVQTMTQEPKRKYQPVITDTNTDSQWKNASLNFHTSKRRK